jgi:glycosyltransferase involved in cell wall biosynthesis
MEELVTLEREMPRFRVLHVLTLNGRNGEYGGPVRVARELCMELNKRGYTTQIFSGVIKNSQPVSAPGLNESYVLVKPLWKKFRISSLWSWGLIRPLGRYIKSSDVVHIHFSRDLIPFLSAVLSIYYQKPYVTQTHGMIVYDGRFATRLIDKILTRPLLNKSSTNLVLTTTEASATMNLKIKSLSKEIPNGIDTNLPLQAKFSSNRTVAFCARLEERKGVAKFIDLASNFRDSGIQFKIYGPDGGALNSAKQSINLQNLENSVKYEGAIPAEEVQTVLKEVDLLILPSKNEPYPMAVLEALAVGTPVLVMPSCGLAETLRNFEPSFVATSESLAGLLESFSKQLVEEFCNKSRKEIYEFCIEMFGIKDVVDSLLQVYKGSINYEC